MTTVAITDQCRNAIVNITGSSIDDPGLCMIASLLSLLRTGAEAATRVYRNPDHLKSYKKNAGVALTGCPPLTWAHAVAGGVPCTPPPFSSIPQRRLVESAKHEAV